MDRLAIVVPCYNEEAVLRISSKELGGILDDLKKKNKIAEDSFVLFVDDGSKDETWSIIKEEHSLHPQTVFGLKLGGNVGHQNALLAGLISASEMCDVTVSIDADLQDDTAVIEEMLDKYHEGKDIVFGVRKNRTSDTFFKRTTALGFYKFMRLMGVNTVYNHADFRLMSRRAVLQLAEYKESNLYLRGIVASMGFESDSVFYDRKERVAGESKYPLGKMMSLAFNGISSFSIRPISLVMWLGITIIILCIAAAVYALVSYFMGNVTEGWTSLILSIWFLGGVQLLCIGLVGQYIGKIYTEVKQRPRYNIDKLLTDKSDEK